MKYFEMFTGVAGFSVGIEKAYGKEKAECVGFSEIEKHASAVLRYRYPDVANYGDATELVPADIPDFDILCAGFPCQSFSIAGQQQGFNDTRGTLFFEIARILSHKRPAHFLLENVKHLAGHDAGKTITRILGVLTDLDYYVEMPVLNSADFRVAQNRERCFIVGHLATGCSGEILSFTDCDRASNETEPERSVSGTVTTKKQGAQCQFDASTTIIVGSDISYAIDSNYHKGASPSDMESGMKRQMIMHKEKRGMRTLDDVKNSDLVVVSDTARGLQIEVRDGKHSPPIRPASGGDKVPMVGTLRTHNDGLGFREMKSGLCPTIPARAREDGSGQPVIKISQSVASRGRQNEKGEWIQQLEKRDDDKANAITNRDTDSMILTPDILRRLTPTECARLQGFADDHAVFGINDKGKEYRLSDTALYRVFGNAVTTTVVEAIIRRMRATGCLP